MSAPGNPVDTLNTLIAVLSCEIDADSASREDVIKWLYERLGLELGITELVKKGRPA